MEGGVESVDLVKRASICDKEYDSEQECNIDDIQSDTKSDKHVNLHTDIKAGVQHRRRTDGVSIDRRRSLLDRHRMLEEKNILRGFINLFWITMGYLILLIMVRNLRLSQNLITFQTLKIAFGEGLGRLSINILVLSILAVCTYPLVVSGYSKKVTLSILHVSFVGFALKQSTGWPALWIMIYLMICTVLMMKIHSYALMQSGYQSSDAKFQSNLPNSGRFMEFVFHLLCPFIVYKSHIKRTTRIRLRFIFEQLTGSILCWFLAHLIIEHYILPHLLAIKYSNTTVLLDSLINIFIPSLIVYLLLFLMFFDFWLSTLSEILFIEERQFFGDWWNSHSLADFSRKWNIPVHCFIHTHIYTPLRVNCKLSKKTAGTVSFTISAVVHEFILWAALGRRSIISQHVPFIFGFQMAQLPLMRIGRWLEGCSPYAANLFFWFGMVFGPPVITLLYIRF